MALPPVSPTSKPLSANCPHCGAALAPGTTVCDSCGTPITAGSASNPAHMSPSPAAPAAPHAIPTPTPAKPVEPEPTGGFSIGIWGTKEAGKTMYLGMLHINMMRGHSRAWNMRPWNDAANGFIGTVEVALANHQFVSPTATTAIADQFEDLWFQIFRRDSVHNRDQEYSLRVLNISGELYQYPEGAVINGVNVLQEYLTNCKGLLCLVDPDSTSQEQLNIYLGKMLRTLYMKNNHQRVDKRFAFCLTKMDLPAHRPHLNNPAPYVQQKLGTLLVDSLRDYCIPGKVNFNFACSAVGFYPGMERSNSGIDWQGKAIIYETDKIQPFGLLEPLEWLLAGISS